MMQNEHSTKINATFRCVVDDTRCCYRTGKCQNLQALKRNGKLHKLCEFHRERANMNQKKLDRKKRMERSKVPLHMRCGSASSVTFEDKGRCLNLKNPSPRTVEAVTSNNFYKTKLKPELDSDLFLPTSLEEAPLGLGCEELAIFCSLMTFDINRMPLPIDMPFLRTSSHHPTSIVWDSQLSQYSIISSYVIDDIMKDIKIQE